MHSPGWGTPSADTGGRRVTLDDMMRAHRSTAAFLASQRSASIPSPLPAASLAPMLMPSAAADGAHTKAPPRPAPVSPTPPRAHRRIVGCPACGEHFTPAATPKKKPNRRLPPTPRFMSWMAERKDGSVSLSAIARRFNLTRDQLSELLRRLYVERVGVVLNGHDRGGGKRFVLLGVPHRPQTPTL